MYAPGTIPATVAILTRDSGRTLEKALESVRAFKDVLICDGGSTDATRDIAARYGARVVTQDASYLDESGRIVDFGQARNQCLAAAREEWFLVLDADEALTPELVEEMGNAAQGAPNAYWVLRRYVWHEKPIACATTYPSKQMRFFARSVVEQFRKAVHERIVLRPGTVVNTCTHAMLVPMETDRARLWAKWNSYIRIEAERHQALTFSGWLRILVFHARASLVYAFRLPRILICAGPTLPLWRELDEHLYNVRVVSALFWKITSLRWLKTLGASRTYV